MTTESHERRLLDFVQRFQSFSSVGLWLVDSKKHCELSERRVELYKNFQRRPGFMGWLADNIMAYTPSIVVLERCPA